mmetsp:Transcript_124095/g.247197  ORF Transcript_124095/g.247197 Transcript_124095/m.247197 type:complete len:653 (+) Transcript_124095:764-2722(+)
MNQLEVTHVTCTPSLWQYLEADAALPLLQTVCLGGERSPQPLLEQWSTKLTLLNTYGTTECTVWQTLRHMQLGDHATLVGKSYPGNSIQVLEQGRLEALADGERGEIVQGGVQVGLGYHQRPELTAECFVTIPGLDGRWYRTGDGGRIVNGELEVLGRFDNQVKIRGMRVELGDIEAGVVKASCGLLRNCAVVLREGGFLDAYCQVSADACVMMHEAYCIYPVVSDFLLQQASLELPRHMLPGRYVLMQLLPLTTNGKVNNKQLPRIVDVAATTSTALTPMESVVAGVWGEVLGRKGISPNDHFLALGGHSLSVLQVSRRLLTLASVAGQDVNPTSNVAILLSPEKLIHSPRLRPYCQMLARGGVRFGDRIKAEEPAVIDKDELALADLRINYTKHKVKRPKFEEEEQLELDHSAWEQVPQASEGELLCRAAEAGLLPLVQLLLTRRASPEGHLAGHHRRHGLTPLHLAVSGNHFCCAEQLLTNSANPMIRDSHGSLPLHKAAERSGARMVEILIKANADPEAIDTATRSTALHLAARSGNIATLEALIPRVGLDWLDRWNRTALHWTVFHGHVEACRQLLDSGANKHGTVGERSGRFLFTPTCCGNLPHRVSKQAEKFVTPAELARARFAGGGPVLALLAACGGNGDKEPH